MAQVEISVAKWEKRWDALPENRDCYEKNRGFGFTHFSKKYASTNQVEKHLVQLFHFVFFVYKGGRLHFKRSTATFSQS